MRKYLAIVFLAVCLFLPILQIDAFAQFPLNLTTGEKQTSENVTGENIAKLVSKLTKEEIEVLNKLLKAITDEVPGQQSSEAENTNILTDIKSVWSEFSKSNWANFIALPSAVAALFQIVVKIIAGRDLAEMLVFTGLIALVFFIGILAEFASKKITRRWAARKSELSGEKGNAVLPGLSSRIFDEFIHLATFIIGALIAANLLITNSADRLLIVSFILYVPLIIRTMNILLGLALAPDNPARRLVSTDDWSARFIYNNFQILSGIIAITLFVLPLLNYFQISGKDPFQFWISNITILSILYTTWRARKGISAIIRGREDILTPGLERMAAWWPAFSMIVITIQFLIMKLGLSTGALNFSAGTGVSTIGLIVFAPFFDTALRAAISHFLPEMKGSGPVAEAAYYETKNSYLRIGRVILIGLIILIIGKLWGIDYQALTRQGFGANIAARAGGFLLILAIGYFIWELVNFWTNRQLAKDSPVNDDSQAHDSGEGGGAGLSRLASVLPLVRMALQISITVIVVLLGLSQLGINITPLLAGAGVFGLAIGFGAQALVKDIVSGVFFLWDDAFRLGEYVDIEGTVGTVEKISIRSLQLRHPNGPVHVIPYGEIPKLTNHSRDYVIMKLRFTVPFDTDIEKVRKLFKKIGQEMLEVPALKDSFIKPFKSQGVADVDDVGIIIRGKFTTNPGSQWAIRKEVYARVQKAFDENGIQFARREVRVQMPRRNGEELKPEEAEAVAAAVSEATNTANEAAPVKKDDPF